MRFQQTSAAVMAKGLEDTAFYSFNRMIALNDVGGDPEAFGITQHAFYRWSREIHQKWPRTMLATSTHDTKRSEDVRARLFVLSEIPSQWASACRQWAEMNRHIAAANSPIATWNTTFIKRLWVRGRLRKIALFSTRKRRPAKPRSIPRGPSEMRNTKPRFENSSRGCMAIRDFADRSGNSSRDSSDPGRVNSLAQTLIKLTAPGVPDFYQGCELWDLSLVDPDNRRPVDFARRRALLSQSQGGDSRAGDGAGRGGFAQAVADQTGTCAAPPSSGVVRRRGGHPAPSGSRQQG